MSEVIIVNGPPECGKDIAVKAMMRMLKNLSIPVEHRSMKALIYKQVQLFYSLNDEQMHMLYFGPRARELKEKPHELLRGRSPRQALIHMSEVVTKPEFGEDFYGKHAANSDTTVLLLSDGGFPDEIDPFVDKHGFDNIAIIRVTRVGTDFSNDSRDYLPDGLCGTYYDITNFMKFDEDNEKEYIEFLDRVCGIARNFLRLEV